MNGNTSRRSTAPSRPSNVIDAPNAGRAGGSAFMTLPMIFPTGPSATRSCAVALSAASSRRQVRHRMIGEDDSRISHSRIDGRRRIDVLEPEQVLAARDDQSTRVAQRTSTSLPSAMVRPHGRAPLHRRRPRLHLSRPLRPDERLARRAQGGPAVDVRGHADRRALRVRADADAARRRQPPRAHGGGVRRQERRADVSRRDVPGVQGDAQRAARRAPGPDGVLREDRRTASAGRC